MLGAHCCSLHPLLVPRMVYMHSCVRMLRERIPRTCHHASCHDVLQGACRTGTGRATPMTCCTWDTPSRTNSRIMPSTLASIRTTTPSHWRSRTRPRHAQSAQHPIITVALQPPWPCGQVPLMQCMETMQWSHVRDESQSIHPCSSVMLTLWSPNPGRLMGAHRGHLLPCAPGLLAGAWRRRHHAWAVL